MMIRQEQPSDYAEVYELVKITFATSTNEGEWDYLMKCEKNALIPEISLPEPLIPPLRKAGQRMIPASGCTTRTAKPSPAGRRLTAKYIQNQLQNDIASDQMSLIEHVDPFTGEPVKKGK